MLKLNKSVKNSKDDFEAFNKLSMKVFGLSFENWFNSGYWGDNYCSYTFFDDVKAVANVSVSKIYTLVNGEPKLYIQLGNVSTDPDYRHQGLIRKLIQEVIHDFHDACDGIYLYANRTVLDFYPKFGFKKEAEYQYSKEITPNPAVFTKLDMGTTKDVILLESCYKKNNPFSARPMLNNFGLVMFYCGDSMRENVYYSEKLQAVIIASFKDNYMLCYDIYCDEGANIDTVLESAAQKDTNTVIFGFTPKNITGCSVKKLENDNQLFVHELGDNMFAQSKMMLPLLSHA